MSWSMPDHNGALSRDLFDDEKAQTCDGCGEAKDGIENVANPFALASKYLCPECRALVPNIANPDCTCGGRNICTTCVLRSFERERAQQ